MIPNPTSRRVAMQEQLRSQHMQQIFRLEEQITGWRMSFCNIFLTFDTAGTITGQKIKIFLTLDTN